MPIADLYFKRQKRLRGEYPDVYQYDTLPSAFRHQVVHILRDVTSSLHPIIADDCYRAIHDVFCREIGVLSLPAQRHQAWEGIVCDYIAVAEETDFVLSLVELTVATTTATLLEGGRHGRSEKQVTENAIVELNTRFRENGLGYQFESGKLVRVDSQVVHAEVVKPVLQLLAAGRFAGPQSEFLAAHEHYRHGDYAATLNECLKAFESTLKVICDGREGWTYGPTDRAKSLLDIVFNKGLIPPYTEGQFTGLRSVLADGVPTIRNNESGHGAGATPKVIPEHIASYALHLAASSILFLARADDALPR